jgi:hypothetical protein
MFVKKYQYQINDRVLVFNNGDWIIPGTITTKGDGMYKVEYDCGGYDWLLSCELTPLEYCVGDYVETTDGIGKIKDINEFFLGVITVTYGKQSKCYYEYELKPAPKPNLLARLFRKGTYLYD